MRFRWSWNVANHLRATLGMCQSTLSIPHRATIPSPSCIPCLCQVSTPNHSSFLATLVDLSAPLLYQLPNVAHTATSGLACHSHQRTSDGQLQTAMSVLFSCTCNSLPYLFPSPISLPPLCPPSLVPSPPLSWYLYHRVKKWHTDFLDHE